MIYKLFEYAASALCGALWLGFALASYGGSPDIAIAALAGLLAVLLVVFFVEAHRHRCR